MDGNQQKNWRLILRTLSEIYKDYSRPERSGGGDKGSSHSYIQEYYGHVLEDYRPTLNTVCEVGIFKGDSLLMWREYFPNARIVGVDISVPSDLHKKLTENNIEVIIGSQTDPNVFKPITNIDVFIDDGSHKVDHQIKTFGFMFDKLNSGGIYIIEDVKLTSAVGERFKKMNSNAKIFDFSKLKNRMDDVIVEVRK